MAFYVTLPSNGSQYFPENRAGNYKIKLPYKIRLSPKTFEVALTELTYICSLKTFTSSNYDNVIEYAGKIGGSISLPLLHYSNIEHLLHVINEEFERLDIPCNLHYSAVKSRVCFTVGNGFYVTISLKLSEILGFNGKTEYFSEELDQVTSTFFYGRFRPDMCGGRYHMFIYCDVIEPQIVGSTIVPLLRMVNIIGEEGEAVTQRFSNPIYIPVSLSEFEIISILLCDEFGEELPIDKGQVTLTLHFKEKN